MLESPSMRLYFGRGVTAAPSRSDVPPLVIRGSCIGGNGIMQIQTALLPMSGVGLLDLQAETAPLRSWGYICICLFFFVMFSPSGTGWFESNIFNFHF